MEHKQNPVGPEGNRSCVIESWPLNSIKAFCVPNRCRSLRFSSEELLKFAQPGSIAGPLFGGITIDRLAGLTKTWAPNGGRTLGGFKASIVPVDSARLEDLGNRRLGVGSDPLEGNFAKSTVRWESIAASDPLVFGTRSRHKRYSIDRR
jgi:hypothetical protein